MGCNFSIFNKNKDKHFENNVSLLNNYNCFMCNTKFPTNNEYNKHIPNCKMASFNKK